MSNLDLTVRIGASLDTLKPITINDDAHPGRIQTDKFDGYITARIRDYPDAPHSKYFDDENNTDLFCIQICGRFLLEQPCITADDIQFGNQFERPLQLPFGSSLLLKFAQWWDPGLQANLKDPKPYAFSPLIITMNQIQSVQENITALSMDLKTPEDRRAFFKYPQNRKAVDVGPNQVWNMQFSNPYIDFNKCTVKVPGFEMDVLKYWDGQPLRYYAKISTTEEVIFIIEFDLRRTTTTS
ncbi:hypothetical protein BDB00DRAFT_782980 [Zychaea mexicana]|uniref:uncharacterized protein n=1 Tax=Zychaea mexicana TaxID=64656 RepID=UPI0022FE47DC|nr:uncharacterized protein BDB00DRAFT_782980 [Zychaea mexicana]KAI9499467.1 hypothetical protein BDB00DRAFT_782980 [Zychaea mexicana]